MKVWKTIVIVAVFGVLSFGVYNLWTENQKMDQKLNKVSETYKELKSENRDIKEEIEHFQNTENLKEEARKNFNYKEPGEKMMIIVPGESEESN